MTNVFQTGVAILSFFVSSFAFSQDSTVVRDFELWTGVNLKKSFLDKKLDLGLSQEFRLNDNSTRINNYFTELTARYEVYKGLNVGGGFRYIKNNTNDGYQNERRFQADLSYKHKVDRLSLSYRFRFTNHKPFGEITDDDITNKYRLRFKADYNIKNWKLDPYFSMEGFYATSTNTINYIPEVIEESDPVAGFEKVRFTLGTSYKIKKWLSIDGFYRIEREFGSYPLHYNTPRTYFIAGLGLTFKL
jgi:hypothetical protein